MAGLGSLSTFLCQLLLRHQVCLAGSVNVYADDKRIHVPLLVDSRQQRSPATGHSQEIVEKEFPPPSAYSLVIHQQSGYDREQHWPSVQSYVARAPHQRASWSPLLLHGPFS